jgi:hypothetical protein
MEIWGNGDLEKWGYGDIEIWGIWIFGYCDDFYRHREFWAKNSIIGSGARAIGFVKKGTVRETILTWPRNFGRDIWTREIVGFGRDIWTWSRKLDLVERVKIDWSSRRNLFDLNLN